MIRKILAALMLSSALFTAYSCEEKPGYTNDEYDPLNPNKKPSEETDTDEVFYPKAEGSFRIMSYNVGAFGKFMTNSTKDIAKMIKEVEADVVGLNELDSCNTRHNVNQVAQLAAELGWQWHFGRTIAYKGGAYGNGAVLPRNHYIDEKYSIPLPKVVQSSESRGVTVVDTEKYVLAVTHLDHTSGDNAVAQANAINQWVEKQYKNCEKPVFLVGDMNSIPTDNAIKALETLWTRISSIEPTIPVDAPNKCIDFIFHYKKSAPVKVISTHTMTKFRTGDVTKTSDHLPVYADVTF